MTNGISLTSQVGLNSSSNPWLELLTESGLSAWKRSHLCAKNGTSGKRCDIDGQPERASVWENASQCEELTAIFATILKRAKTS